MDRMAAMEAFVLVVDTGSFSAAARRLNVGQPAVSKMVAQLEDRLGIKLLMRTTRGLTATEAGLNYYERARRSIEGADEAELDARGAGSGLTGRLRISAAVTFARIHLMPHLPEFLAQHPGLEVDVVLDDRNIDLVHEGIDVALRMGRLTDSTLTARRIASGRQVVLASPAYFARVGEPATPRAAVLADAGIAVASEWMFAPEIADGTVKAVLQDWELPRIDLWAVFPAGRTATAKARTFTQFVQDVMRIPNESPGTLRRTQ
jgi:DNA-binding transcriptional LysR family regulator